VNGELCWQEETCNEATFAGIVGQSAGLRQVLQLVETVAH
jgi:transcriptional regulator with GAF, ATPase, and Fis domain